MGTYYGPKELEYYVTAFWDPVGFLEGEWSYEKQQAFNNMYNFNIAGWSPYRANFDDILNHRNDLSYMDRYGVDWKNVKDPRKLSQSRSSAAVHHLNFVSDNVKRLYR